MALKKPPSASSNASSSNNNNNQPSSRHRNHLISRLRSRRASSLRAVKAERRLDLQARFVESLVHRPRFVKGGDRSALQRFRHYQALEMIGEGTGGKVYLLQHAQDKRSRLAVKVYFKAGAATTEPALQVACVKGVEMMRNEHRILSSVPPHKHLIKLYDGLETLETVSLFMELAPKGDLFELLVRTGPLKEEEACLFFTQLLSVVEHLHRHGYVHRDIKPENLLLRNRHRLMLTDFGSAAAWSPHFLHTQRVGSLEYAAPEVLAEHATYVGPEVDMWSCGAVLYTMLKGMTPFGGYCVDEILANIQRRKLDLEGLSVEVQHLLLSLLEPCKEKRATMEEDLKLNFLMNSC
ncbi:BMP-2-inducible protein kinase [Balamuthia mandrillaris]